MPRWIVRSSVGTKGEQLHPCWFLTFPHAFDYISMLSFHRHDFSSPSTLEINVTPGWGNIGHKNYFQLAIFLTRGNTNKIKRTTRFQLTSLARRLFSFSSCLSFVQADHFNFGHARDTIIHWLFQGAWKSISLYRVDLNSARPFSLRPLSRVPVPSVIRSALPAELCIDFESIAV